MATRKKEVEENWAESVLTGIFAVIFIGGLVFGGYSCGREADVTAKVTLQDANERVYYPDLTFRTPAPEKAPIRVCASIYRSIGTYCSCSVDR